MSHPIYIFAGGGTGGHLYPGLAVAEQVTRLAAGAKIVFACSYRAIDRRILDAQPYGIVPQPVRPAPRSPRDVGSFVRNGLASMLQARDMIRDLRPAAVLGLGGFAAAPLVRAAARANVPAALLNPDAVPGKANRFLARRCGAIFVQFPATRDCFPPGVRARVRDVGCPIRSGFLSPDRHEALRLFGLSPDHKTLLVNGGSLGAASINEAAAALVGELNPMADSWQVLHVTGPEKHAQIAASYAGQKIKVCCLEFCQRMDLAYAAADLAVVRAGASTVAELCAAGTPAVLMPYPYHADRQQWLNAGPLAVGGAGIILEDHKQCAPNLTSLRATLLPLLSDDARLAEMRQAALRLAKPRAAEDVARWLLDPR